MRRLAVLLLAAPALLSCSSKSSGAGDAAPPSNPAPPPAGLIEMDATRISFATGPFDVPPGDSFTCFYTSVTTDHDLSVTGAKGVQASGGHHITVYYTDVPQDPTHHPCTDQEMVSWHQIAAAGAEATGDVLALPSGLALKVPAGKQLVIQSHYIDTSGQTQSADDTVDVELIDPANVTSYVNQLVLSDVGFMVPPHAQATSSLTCTLTQDFPIVLMLGHEHQYGTQYTFERVDDAGNSLEMLEQFAWSPVYTSHPPITRFTVDAPKVFPKGTKVRQTCTWDNTTDEPVLFPREMCVSFLYYFPDAGSFLCDKDQGTTKLEGDSSGAAGSSGSMVPAASCVQPGDQGNANGVGTPCTPGGGECKAFPKAGLCLADVGQDQWFCTRISCSTDADCGDGAVCHHDPDGSACVPARCEPSGSGGGGAGTGGASGSAGAGGLPAQKKIPFRSFNPRFNIDWIVARTTQTFSSMTASSSSGSPSKRIGSPK